MIGQDAVATAKAFHETLDLDGVILTKLDGDARGGAALSVKEVVGRPIAFASTGEKIADFDLFHPDRMADRILGMGDVLSLIEQAERTMDADVVAEVRRPDDARAPSPSTTSSPSCPGPQDGLARRADAADARHDQGDAQGGRPASTTASSTGSRRIVRSMTPRERQDPSLIDGSRRRRIARGSGTSIQDVNQLLKQFARCRR